jgi:hypothetical protein
VSGSSDRPTNSTLVRLRKIWNRSLAVVRSPRVRIEMYGDAHALRIYRAYTARHRRFKVTQTKRWGVALIRLPATMDEYLAGSSKELLRRKRRSAQRSGFRYAVVAAADHIDEILAINLSSPVRQGRALPKYYLDREHVAETFRDRPTIHGILNAAGQLRAYAWVPQVGELAIFETLLGHADDLEAGVMYLLISEVVGATIAARDTTGSLSWAMYDTFWGAAPGLAYFKERLGFKSYTVDWVWIDRS